MTTPTTVLDHDQPRRFGLATPGIGPTAAATEAADGGSAPRRRRWPIAVAIVAAVAIGLVGGRLSAPAHGAPVLVVTHPIAAGAAISPADVRVAHITNAPTGRLHDVTQLRGLVARTNLPAEQLLTWALLVPPAELPAAGTIAVGIAVGNGQGPAQPLVVGDRVTVIDVPVDNGSATTPVPRVLAINVLVSAVSIAHDGTERITVDIPTPNAVAVAASAAAGRAAVVLAPH